MKVAQTFKYKKKLATIVYFNQTYVTIAYANKKGAVLKRLPIEEVQKLIQNLS